MNSLESVTTFFGWTAVINIGLLAFSSLMVIVARDAIARIHGRMFAVEPAELPLTYFRYIAQFKIMVIIFSVTPYIALKLMA